MSRVTFPEMACLAVPLLSTASRARDMVTLTPTHHRLQEHTDPVWGPEPLGDASCQFQMNLKAQGYWVRPPRQGPALREGLSPGGPNLSVGRD